VRKTAKWSVISAEHQRIALEALEDRYAGEPLRWKKSRLSRMIRGLEKAIEVNEQREKRLLRARSGYTVRSTR
jgi:hypothetical protein